MKAERGELRVWALMYFITRYEIRLLGVHPTRYHAQMARYEYLREGEKHEGEPVNPDHARRHAVAPIEMMCEIVDEGEGPVLKLTGSLPTKNIKLDDE
jgi:hypothetical protein